MKEIASALVISENTLKSHTKRIFRKLGTHNRVKLMQYARELGIQVDGGGDLVDR